MQQQNNNLKNLLNVSPLGDTFVYDEVTDSILYRFSGKRKVMSTSIWNGGYQEDLAMVFNHTCNADECYMLAPTYEEHMRIIIQRMELDELQVCGMLTAAKMEHVAFEIAEYQALSVMAVVTAGVELNAGVWATRHLTMIRSNAQDGRNAGRSIFC
jgi:adenosylcobinamide amidohydrolase